MGAADGCLPVIVLRGPPEGTLPYTRWLDWCEIAVLVRDDYYGLLRRITTDYYGRLLRRITTGDYYRGLPRGITTDDYYRRLLRGITTGDYYR